jgi:hypothetical protein
MIFGLLTLVGCVTIHDREKPEWDFKTAAQRLKDNPLPKTYFIFNDHQLGWLYNGGVRFSNPEFKEYVYGLEIIQGCKEVRFVTGINRHNKEVIRYAVIYYEISEH